MHYECKREHTEYDMQSDIKEQQKTNLIIALADSHSFARTHTVIEELSAYSHFTDKEYEAIFAAAVNNSQVECIINDSDLYDFYTRLLSGYNGNFDGAAKVAEMLRID